MAEMEVARNGRTPRDTHEVSDKLNQTYNHKKRTRASNHHRSRSLKQRIVNQKVEQQELADNEIYIDEDGEILSDLSKVKRNSQVNKNGKAIIYRNMGPSVYNTSRIIQKDPSRPKYQRSFIRGGPEFDNNSLSTIVLDPTFDQQTMFDVNLATSKRKLDPVVMPPECLDLPFTTISLDQGRKEGEFQVNAVDLATDYQQQMLGDLEQNSPQQLSGRS